MLKYIWMVIQDLFLTVTFVTLIHAVLNVRFGKKGTAFHRCGIVIGIIASIGLAIAKNTTNKVVSSQWNHYLYAILIVLTLLFVVFAVICGSGPDKKTSAAGLLMCLSGSAFSAVRIFYTLPGAAAYPFNFNTMGNGYLSWFYAQRLLGWLAAYLVLIIYARLLYLCALEIKNKKVPKVILICSMLSSAFYCFCRFFVPWVNRAKWLKWPVKYVKEKHGWAGELVKLTSAYAMWFIWLAAILVLVLAILLILENIKVTEPYDNPAQLRKLRAGNRGRRRLACALLVFLAFIVVSLTLIKTYDTREIALSEPESYEVDGDVIRVSMEDVSDGHLHRFEYETQNGVNVRWIVVKKPGSASFGVGLDACEVCGNAGYYERNNQVVCKRCDVVMNINTIGFKGGCNPIPLSYEVDGGSLVFKIADLENGEKEFR